jgi:hypothetical protein
LLETATHAGVSNTLTHFFNRNQFKRWQKLFIFRTKFITIEQNFIKTYLPVEGVVVEIVTSLAVVIVVIVVAPCERQNCRLSGGSSTSA